VKISPKLKDDQINIHEYTFTRKDGKRYTAKRATQAQKTAARSKYTKIFDDCDCGEEWCDGQWLWRCMYAGGGECDWYITNTVCP
jgi:hypothetical protein